MMEKLINSIVNKEFEKASNFVKEEISSIVEKKMAEKKKMLAANASRDVPFKTDVEMTGSVKAQRKPLKGVTKVLKDVKEAVVQEDGLVHLHTGEKILPSVYRARRWLSEGADNVSPADDWHENFWDRVADVSKYKKIKSVNEHLNKALMHYKKQNTDDAEDHLRQAEKESRKFDDDMKKTYKKQNDLKEDCGLAPDKEEKLHAALDKAKLLIQPQLDTTAPTVNRMKVRIPKGARPADRHTAPDLGPKEDEWMCGEKLSEMRGDAQYDKPDPLANRAFTKKLTKKGKMTKDSLRTAKWAAKRNLEDLRAQKKPDLKEAKFDSDSVSHPVDPGASKRIPSAQPYIGTLKKKDVPLKLRKK